MIGPGFAAAAFAPLVGKIAAVVATLVVLAFIAGALAF